MTLVAVASDAVVITVKEGTMISVNPDVNNVPASGAVAIELTFTTVTDTFGKGIRFRTGVTGKGIGSVIEFGFGSPQPDG